MERLSGLDTTFLTFETPSVHMHVAQTAIFDPCTVPGGYEFTKIKEHIRSRLHLVPPFRRRIVEVPFNLHHPIWVEDPDFDIDYHVRRVGVPRPGSLRDLSELAGRIASRPLDRTRPLWESYICEGMENGRIGVITKMHHCAVDGVSGAELMANLFDLTPAGPTSSPGRPRARARADRRRAGRLRTGQPGPTSGASCCPCSARRCRPRPTSCSATATPTPWSAPCRSPPPGHRGTRRSRRTARCRSPESSSPT